jgi:TonB family protein
MILAPPAEAWSDASPQSLPKGLSVHEDRRARETTFRPAHDSWTLYDFRIYPVLRLDAKGTRSLLLHVSRQGDKRIGIKSLQVRVDGVSRALAPKRSEIKVDAYGCRVTETALLEGQDDLIRAIAVGREVDVDVVGVDGPQSFRLTPEEIGSFVRIVALRDADSLPEPEKPPADPVRGREGLTNPRIIRESKVMPEFPVLARGRMATGKVTLHAVVHPDGTAEVLDVFKSSARYCGFEQAAIDAVRQWRYVPGREDGKPTDFYFTVDIDFQWK